MLWVIRGTNEQTGQDFAQVVEARSQAAAESWALKRGMAAAFVGQAEESDIDEARRTKQLWKYTPDARQTFFGRPVGARQMVCFIIAGVATMVIVYARTSTQLPKIRFGAPTASRTIHRQSAVPTKHPVCGEFDTDEALSAALSSSSQLS